MPRSFLELHHLHIKQTCTTGISFSSPYYSMNLHWNVWQDMKEQRIPRTAADMTSLFLQVPHWFILHSPLTLLSSMTKYPDLSVTHTHFGLPLFLPESWSEKSASDFKAWHSILTLTNAVRQHFKEAIWKMNKLGLPASRWALEFTQNAIWVQTTEISSPVRNGSFFGGGLFGMRRCWCPP